MMLRAHWLYRLAWMIVLVFVVTGLSGCYKDAGDDLEPTSNRVDVNDIAPTATPTMMPTQAPTVLPTTQPAVTPGVRTLVPTTTPADFVPTQGPVGPTPTSPFVPSFTPAVTAAPTEPGIATPGMSDIQPSFTPHPTLDPAFQPTPTDLPVEENPCIHVVQPNDTLYSIAQANNVLLDALVAANPSFLGGNENTPLQIGWELQIPGCVPPGTEPTATAAAADMTPTLAPGTTTTHVVQSGETIYSIGRLYGVDPQAIIDANNLANPDRISVGQTLIIPAPQ
jgi:LysM repeat protein